MKKKLCMLLLGLCLVSMSACKGADSYSNRQHSDKDDYAMNDTVKTPDKVPEKDSVDDDLADEDSADEDFADNDSADENSVDEDNNAASNDAENEDAKTNEELVDGMRPEFKEAMDSYEAFYDEYCDILNKYAKNPSDMKLLADYTNMLTKVVDVSEKFEAWEEEDLNDAEMKYYLEVSARIAQKLLEVSE